MAFQIARKHMLVAKVVGHAAHVAGVGNGNGRHAAPVVAVAAGQFFGKVHGIAHGAAIAAGEDAATGGKAGNQLLGSGFDAGQRLGIGQQIVQCVCASVRLDWIWESSAIHHACGQRHPAIATSKQGWHWGQPRHHTPSPSASGNGGRVNFSEARSARCPHS
jgi:hypothetical protein